VKKDVKHVWVSIFVGVAISATLFVASYSAHLDFLYWLQAIGFYATMAVRGVHAATKTDFATIAIPVNGAVYALAVFCMARLIAKRKDERL
jgi:hypothetical protein